MNYSLIRYLRIPIKIFSKLNLLPGSTYDKYFNCGSPPSAQWLESRSSALALQPATHDTGVSGSLRSEDFWLQ